MKAEKLGVLLAICLLLSTVLVGVAVYPSLIITDKGNLIFSLNSQFNDKESELPELVNQNNQLTQKIVNLQNQISLLTSQIQNLTVEKDKLQAWLDGNKTLLEQTKTLHQSNVTYYEYQIGCLQNQIESVQSEIDYLNEQLRGLEETYAYLAAYQRLMGKVNQRRGQIKLQVFITSEDQKVRDVVYSVTGGWSDPTDWNEFWTDVKALYNWVVNNVEYRSDSLYPVLLNETSQHLVFWDEVWQFPNETLTLRKGDCEDMAILLCSMIRCYNNMKCSAECILIESSTSGHVAVQLPVSEKKLVILDPAGKYYSHDFWGNIAFNDIVTEINNWLNHWKHQMGSDVQVCQIFSDYTDMRFTSTNEYLSWMYNR